MNSFFKKHASKLLFVTLNAIAVFFIASLVQSPVFRQVQTNNTITQNNSTSPTPQVAGESTDSKDTFLVTKVIDGDTIELENGQKVRYIGIDTPETVDPRRPVGCFGKEASDKNKELVLNKKVQLIKDVSETDKYGRLLRYVYVNDIFVNNTLVREGFANASTYPPDVKFAQQFKKAEEEARNQGKGLWGSCNK
jgi:micrococcal nuclease